MSDDGNRDERERHDRETDEFGGPLFSDRRHQADQPTQAVDEQDSGGLSFGENDTGPLPHWTDPPTGEIPRFEPTDDPSGGVEDEIDVWSSFTSESPIWREDLVEDAEDTGQIPRDDVTGGFGVADPSGGYAPPSDPSGPVPRTDTSGPIDRGDSSGPVRRAEPPTGQVRRTESTGQHRRVPSGSTPAIGRDPTGPVPAARREPSRIQIGTDPSGVQRRQPPPQRRARGGGNRRGPQQQGSEKQRRPAAGSRDMPVAVITALVIAGAFIAASMWQPIAVVVIIVAILAIASYEYFSKVTEKGYRPAVAAGVLACIAAPITTYWFGAVPVGAGIADGQGTVPLVLAFAFIAGAIGFIGGDSVESGPLPNMAITTMGVVWIGVLGSYAAMILTFSTTGIGGVTAAGGSFSTLGTDTLVLIALGVAANDIGALFIGSSTGNTPLRHWISPNKTLEGLIGGTVVTIVVLLVVGMAGLSDTWNDTGEILLLAIVIAVMAPLGDLTESMFKRNLDVKDFGTLVPGHGGVLDRFDAFLFVLPAVYYLLITLQPWTS